MWWKFRVHHCCSLPRSWDKVILLYPVSSQPWRREWCHRFESGTRSGVLGFVPPGHEKLGPQIHYPKKKLEIKKWTIFESRVDPWICQFLKYVFQSSPTWSSRILSNHCELQSLTKHRVSQAFWNMHDIACVRVCHSDSDYEDSYTIVEDPYLPSHFPLLLYNAPKISL